MSVTGPRDEVAGAPGAADAQVPGLGSLGPAAGDEVGRGQRGHAAHQDSQVSGGYMSTYAISVMLKLL